MMNVDKKYMEIALKLAKQGMRKVTPNPMVGCVVVYNNKIIGQGFHQYYGGPHAEVNAITSIQDKNLLKESTIYVTLEPCSHYGKTPPCADLIIKHKIPRVVIACIDTFSEVSGKGILKLNAAGIDVIVGVLEKKAQELNKRFFTFHNKKRPYIILKWAQTQDGFIDVDRNTKLPHNNQDFDNWITTSESKKLVHFWRSKEEAIMIGTTTALNDNPELTVREIEGQNPLRIVLDLNLRLPKHLNLFDQSTPTIIINYKISKASKNLEFVKIDSSKELTIQLLDFLFKRNIQSIIIEGGAKLINTFIGNNIWDEARVFIGEKKFLNGLNAPKITTEPKYTMQIDSDSLSCYIND